MEPDSEYIIDYGAKDLSVNLTSPAHRSGHVVDLRLTGNGF